MSTGYTRNDTGNNIADGNVINASDLDGEFDAIEAAFNASTGHTHDGTSAEGGPIEVVGPAQDVSVTAAAVLPKTDNTYDLGSSSFEWKDLYVDGVAYIDEMDGVTTLTGSFQNSAGAFFGLSSGSGSDLRLGHTGAFIQFEPNKITIMGAPAGANVGISFFTGSGSPEGSVTARPGSIFMDISGGAGTTLYVKESGTGNTGWVAK